MNTVNARAHCMRPILAAGFALALAFTFNACGSDDNGGNLPDPSGSSEEKVFCNLTAGNCSQMSLSACMELVNAGAAQIVANCTEPPPPVVIFGYCDYGPITIYGGGCFPMATAEDQENCALWGNVVNSCPASNGNQCGGKEYNPATEFCYGSCVLCAPDIIYTKCNGNEYNAVSDFCYNNTVYKKCGGAGYNPSTQFCSCGGDNNSGREVICLGGGDTVYEKCGGKEYKPSIQYCSGNTIYAK